jgi:ferredoxin-NADP reductase
LPAALPGQFVALRLRLGAAGPVATRSYSLSGSIGQPDYRVSVKRESHGVVSGFVHSTVQAGAIVDVAAPRGGFVLRDGVTPVMLISAGIGATPVLAMLYALADGGSGREICWLHGARNSAEHPFAAEVRDLLARLPHARAEICYSAPLPTDQAGRDYTRAGRLTAEVLQRLPIATDAQAYICGPQRFMDDIRAALENLGVAPGKIFTEVFGAGAAITPGIAAGPVVPPHQPPGEPGRGPEITFARSGLTARWAGDTGSLLEFAEACDVPTRWSCRTGICHTCESGLLAGSVGYDPPPIDPPADGNVLICCATPREDLVLDL